jgi:peptidoglycan/LPS O-acetylase OafA/YrhL
MRTGSRPIREVLGERRLPVLDGLRAVAALTVLAGHAEVVPHLFHDELVGGSMGVTGFFVLSGFLITWLLLRELDTTGRISLRDFYIRRTLRIWPAYYVFIAAMALIQHPGLSDNLAFPHASQLAAIFFGYDYYSATGLRHDAGVGHLWSVSVEEQFYLLWPAVLLWLLRRGDVRSAYRRTFALVVGLLLWRSFLMLTLHLDSGYTYHAFDSRADSLLIGCLLALWTTQPGFESFARAVAASPLYPLGTLELLILLNQTGWLFMATFGWTIQACLMAVLIVQLLQLYRARLWSWLEHPVARYVGTISYPLYLYHLIALRAGAGLHLTSRFANLAVTVGGAIALASISYYLVERPFLRLKQRFAAEVRRPVRARVAAQPHGPFHQAV